MHSKFKSKKCSILVFICLYTKMFFLQHIVPLLLSTGILTIDISDHLPVFCMADIPLKKDNKQIYFRDFSKFNSESYLQDIYAIDWNAITDQCSDLLEVTAYTIDALKLIVERHAPKKHVSRKQQKLLRKPWISRGILKSIKRKHAMYKSHFLVK